jgi:hypothetical protein
VNTIEPLPMLVTGPQLSGLVAMVVCETFIRRGVEPPPLARAIAQRLQCECKTDAVVKWHETIETIVSQLSEPLPNKLHSAR